MLGPYYRFQVKNATGVTLVAGAVVIYARREKSASDGSLVYEAAEATVFSNGATIVSGAFSNGTTQDNTPTAVEYESGTFIIVVTAPAGALGDVTVWLQRSTNGTRWPDDGKGTQVANLNFAAAGTLTRDIPIP